MTLHCPLNGSVNALKAGPAPWRPVLSIIGSPANCEWPENAWLKWAFIVYDTNKGRGGGMGGAKKSEVGVAVVEQQDRGPGHSV